MTPPNLLLLMTDQLRYDWLGCHGTPGVHTPHLDALAADGVRFTHCVTNAAVCAPARIALATGVRPHRLGVLGNADVLPPGTPTYYQALRDGGYRVGCTGKLDLDKPTRFLGRHGDRPAVFRWGFTHPLETEGKMHAGADAEGHPLGPYGYFLAEHGLWDRFHEDYRVRVPAIFTSIFDRSRPPTDDLYRESVLPQWAFEDVWIAERAVEWVDKVGDDHPWHLFVSFVGPHDPFDPPADWPLASPTRRSRHRTPVRSRASRSDWRTTSGATTTASSSALGVSTARRSQSSTKGSVGSSRRSTRGAGATTRS